MYREENQFKWLKDGEPVVRATKPILFYNELSSASTNPNSYCTGMNSQGYRSFDCDAYNEKIMAACMKAPDAPNFYL